MSDIKPASAKEVIDKLWYPSAIQLDAVRTLELAEQDDRFVVNMLTWGCLRPGAGECEVCFAGGHWAFAVQGGDPLKAGKDQCIRDATYAIVAKFLDAAREYEVFYVVRYISCMGFKLGKLETPLLDELYTRFAQDRCSYEDDPREFKANMREMARILQGYSL